MSHRTAFLLTLTVAMCLAGCAAARPAGPAGDDSPGYTWFLADGGAAAGTPAEPATEKPDDPVEQFLAHQAAGLWELTLERPSTPNTRSGQVRVSAAGSAFEREQGEDGTRVLRWPKVVTGDRALPIAIEAHVRESDGALEFIFRIENQAPGWIVRELRAPIVRRIDAKRFDLLWPDSLGRRVRHPEHMRAARLMYPGWASMQWFALAGDGRGLYVGSHDETFQTTALEVDCDPETGHLEAAVTKYPLAGPGEAWRSPPLVVWSYHGTWHAAARRYRQWAEATWFSDIERPAWVRNTSGIQLAILKQQNGEILWPYEDIAALTAISKESGLDTLGLFGWTGQGHDHLYPYYDPGPDLGGEAALKQALAAARKAGRHPFLYADGHRIDVATAFYRKHGDEVCVVDERGTHRMEYPVWRKYHNASPVATANACLSSERWQKVMLDVAVRAQQLGASGILYDRIGGCQPYLCFNAKHGHAHPALATGPGKRALVRRVRERVKRVDPDFAVLAELVTDCLCQHVDLIHGHGMGTSNQPGSFPELFRYTFPEMIVTQRHPSPLLDRGLANFAVLYGLRHELEFRYAPDVRLMREGVVPEYRDYIDVVHKPNIGLLRRVPRDAAQAYLKTLIAFERKHAALLARGRFVDEVPFTLKGDGVRAKAFAREGRLGVVLWNPSGEARRAEVDVPGYRRVGADAPGTEHVDPATPVPANAIRLLRYVATERGGR
ncbi:MAG: DUF6259 domain-containing protein [Phycisphaerae bacterium]